MNVFNVFPILINDQILFYINNNQYTKIILNISILHITMACVIVIVIVITNYYIVNKPVSHNNNKRKKCIQILPENL